MKEIIIYKDFPCVVLDEQQNKYYDIYYQSKHIWINDSGEEFDCIEVGGILYFLPKLEQQIRKASQQLYANQIVQIQPMPAPKSMIFYYTGTI